MSSREGSMSSHLEWQDQFVNLENRRDREIARSESRSSKPTLPKQRIDKHKRVEDDRAQVKGKEKNLRDQKDNRFNKTMGD